MFLNNLKVFYLQIAYIFLKFIYIFLLVLIINFKYLMFNIINLYFLILLNSCNNIVDKHSISRLLNIWNAKHDLQTNKNNVIIKIKIEIIFINKNNILFI